ncbi:hypothetical protein NE235_05600 [Actinoallomurus spadix]|uniref:Uncharacterized protein n=1 Tax=Actinoallomurus spadix TaxID=79912 RepID=A0ABN0W3Y1_9ACTN|nr:hypothetical protein [Actinoallomurus spadix]MCO5985579.1 hypothetical protein [Actinoallomurus spadix]
MARNARKPLVRRLVVAALIGAAVAGGTAAAPHHVAHGVLPPVAAHR